VWERRGPPTHCPLVWEAPMSEPEFRPGLADVPVAESAVSFIDGQRARLEYRGITVETLARESCFEETAWLLLKGELPTQKELADFKDQLRRHRRIKYKLADLIKCLPETGHPMDALQAGVAAMGMFYPSRDVTNARNNWDSVVRLIAKMPTIVAAFHRLRHGDEAIRPRDDLGHAANFLYMLRSQETAPYAVRALDVSMILYAEHEFNASTFTARVVASTESDLHSCIVAAVGALKGRLHGGANEKVMNVLRAAGGPDTAERWVRDALARKERLMGFGHRVYKSYDPRAKVVKRIADIVFTVTGKNPLLEIALELERIALEDDYFVTKVDNVAIV